MTATPITTDQAGEPENTGGPTDTLPELIRKSASQYPWNDANPKNTSSTDGSTAEPEYQKNSTLGSTATPPIALFPDRLPERARQASFYPLQEWEGYVISVDGDTFTARLIDLTNDDGVEEEADFPIMDLSPCDQRQLQSGAIFRWAIGYRRTPSGSQERVSRIVFRRLPAWTTLDLAQARQKAKALAAALQGE